MSNDPDMAATASWLTVAELKAFDWYGKKILKTGFVEPEMAGLFPPGQKGFPWDQWAKEKRELYPQAGPPHVARVYWEETYAESAGYFLTDVLPKLEALGGPNDVRIVYWFDW
jgi:hypothetical protein